MYPPWVRYLWLKPLAYSTVMGSDCSSQSHTQASGSLASSGPGSSEPVAECISVWPGQAYLEPGPHSRGTAMATLLTAPAIAGLKLAQVCLHYLKSPPAPSPCGTNADRPITASQQFLVLCHPLSTLAGPDSPRTRFIPNLVKPVKI